MKQERRTARTQVTHKLASVLLSVVLTVGLMPIQAFSDPVDAASSQQSQDATSPQTPSDQVASPGGNSQQQPSSADGAGNAAAGDSVSSEPGSGNSANNEAASSPQAGAEGNGGANAGADSGAADVQGAANAPAQAESAENGNGASEPAQSDDPNKTGDSNNPDDPNNPTKDDDADPDEAANLGESGASVHEENDLYEVTVFGDAAESEAAAADAIAEEGIGLQQARLFAAPLFNAANNSQASYPDGDYPRRLDGSDIESISIKWITKDTDGYDNGDDSRLYLVPDGDNPFSVRFQVDYALSGEHNYNPGDIEIRIPAQVFYKRDSNTTSENSRFTGNMIIPLAESPSAKTDFNWTLVGNEYVLTNTKTIIAATKGFIQFEIKDLIPHEIVDMSITDKIQATIEVTTHLGNIIGLKSSELDAQVNTTQEVVRANKEVKTKNNPKVITRDEMLALDAIPQDIEAAYPNEKYFVIVDWYTWSYHTGNQPYTLTAFDTRTDDYDGWVVKGDAKTIDLGVVQQDWYKPGMSSYSSMTTAFPLSQFEPDTTHVFKNHIDYHLEPIDKVDDPTDAGADAQVSWSYSEPEEWGGTIGNFNVFKWGNDDDWGKRADGELTTHQVSSKETGFRPLQTGDIPTPEQQHLQTWYGIYPRALNDLRDGKDARIDYTIKSEGYLLPWTVEGDTRVEENYGKRPVTMVTQDTGLWTGLTSKDVDFELTPLEDVDFISLNFVKPTIGKILRVNMDSEGTPTNPYAGAPGFDYQQDDNAANIPPIKLEVLRNGAWEEYATADWSSGSCVITKADGSVIQGDTVDFPAGTENFRTSVTSTNAFIYYYVRPLVELHPNVKWDALIDGLFAETETPMEPVWNGVNMVAYTHEGDEIVDISKVGHDRLLGYKPDIKVLPHKNGEVTDIDYNKKLVTFHYDAYIEERSVIADLTLYQELLTQELLPKETHATWYDLLPEGVNPIMDSISLNRAGDEIVDAYTIPNFKNTNRTLLVVEAELTPTPETYTEDGVEYYEDKPEISFDAEADLNYIIDRSEITESHGLRSYLHNVIVFESSNDEIGTVDGYRGEANDPNGTNNVATREAWSRYEAEAALEKAALAGLHDGRDTESFLYAGDVTQVDILNTANTSIIKEVSVNNDGRWSQGTYYGDREANARDVYAGGMYSYRVFAISGQDTQTRGMIIYDSLENYVAIEGNDQEDVDAIEAGKRWRGALRSVDLSLLREKGIDPVLYYSTTPELKMQIVEDATEGYKNPDTTNLENTSVWVKASDYTGDLADVHAIAIDCRKAADGSNFILEPEEGITFYINMWAPTGELADDYIQNDHHAYNNIFLEAVSVDAAHGGASEEHFIRQDYVKVGLVENNVTVKKVWDDDENRDGIRPNEVTFTLLRDGQEYHPDTENPFAEEFENPVTVQADAEGKIEYTFKYLPYCDDEGNVFRYSVREDSVDGYKATTRMGRDGTATVTNRHNPERTSVEGTKTWVGDTADVRPSAIDVKLYADGELADTQRVVPDDQGKWSYKFENLFKYRDQGTVIVYTVDESAVTPGSLDAYVPAINGANIENTYHPFGDIELGKMVVGATDATADDVFTFELSMLDADGAPLTGNFEGDILNASGAVVRTESVSNGSSFKLGDGQTIRIKELPAGAQVAATEKVPDGYTARNGESRTLVVKANQMRSHTFENVYRTSGYVNLEAGKTLIGRDEMKNYQFTFKLTNDEAGDDVVATASSRTDGKVTFGAIRYKNEDAGKTHTYYLHENDRGKPGYTYDDAVYKVEVKVMDKGDGTMSCTPTYFQRGPFGIGWVAMGEKPAFVNEYHAKGDLELKAWKTLLKRDLKDKEFTFELVDSKGNVVEATNDTTGMVTFPKLNFTEENDGDELDYTIREKVETDDTVIYSTETYNVHVAISDNGDGTLSLSTTITNAAGESATPVFTNDLKDGKLAVEKLVEDREAPTGEFKFKVKLTGPDVPEDGTYNFTKEQVNRAALLDLLPAGGLQELGDRAIGDLLQASKRLASFFTPTLAYADPGDIASGTQSGMSWRITQDGELLLGKEGVTESLTNLHNTSRTSVWLPYNDQITSVRFVGKVEGYGENDYMFAKLTNLKSADMRNFDMSNLTELVMMFDGCEKLKNVNFDGADVSNVTDIQYMFRDCTSLEELDLSSFTTSSLRVALSVFQDCTALRKLNIQNFDTSNMHDAQYSQPLNRFFSGCTNLRSITLGTKFLNWDELTGSSLPSPSNVLPYSGKWVNVLDNGSIGPKTSADLRAGYAANVATWAGEWVWEEPSFDVLFTTADLENQRTVTLSYEEILNYTLPDYELDDSIFGGWVPSALSSSTGNLVRMQSVSDMNLISYAPTDSDRKVLDPGDPFAGAHVLAAPDGTTDAQKVDAVLKWLPLRANNPYTIAFYAVTYDTYKVNFLPGEGATGSMSSLTDCPVDDDVTIPAPTFYKFNHHVTGWVDEEGNEFSASTIPAGSVTKPEITLTAKWAPDTNTVDIRNGEFEFTLKNNERAIFDNIPAGTAYEVWEETPAGWVLVSSVDETGKIKPLETSTAKFTNEYKPNETSIQLRASKLLDGQPASTAGQFSFTLTGEGQNQTKTNTAGGGVAFDPIGYTLDDLGGADSKTFTYTITEVPGNDSNISYDNHPETVNVLVKKDAEGKLSATATYDESGAVFSNATKKGGLTVMKTVEGPGAPADAEFTFTLSVDKSGDFSYSKTGGETGTIHNGGSFTLKAGETITFALPLGTTYQVTETNLPDGFTLTETTNVGPREIADQSRYVAYFTNKYKPQVTPAALNLEVRKVMKYRELEAGQFDFRLMDADHNLIGIASNDASGKVVFDMIEFTEPGTYTYSITEVEDYSDETIIYDRGEQFIKVTVAPDPNDATKLIATPNYDPDDASTIRTFENKVNTDTYLVLQKHVEGATVAVEDKQFDFKITFTDAAGNPVEGSFEWVKIDLSQMPPMPTGDSGTVASGDTLQLGDAEAISIFGLPHGTNYAIEEDVPAGFELESANAEGIIDIDERVTFANFTNTYSVSGELVLEAQKILEGRSLEDGQFTFELADANGTVLSRVANDATGRVTFGKIPFAVGDIGQTFTFTASEVDDGRPGYTYDDTTLTYTVVPRDNGDGTMSFEVTCEGESETFKNAYRATGEVILKATKTLTGRALAANQFEFEVLDADGEVVATGKNAVDGTVSFEAIPFTLADVGTHVYTIREVVPADEAKAPGYTYDPHEESVTVEVNDDGTGLLKTVVTYDDDGAAFENAYHAKGTATIEATKALTGHPLAADQFSFELRDSQGNVVETVTNDETGKATFADIEFTEADMVDAEGNPVESKDFVYTVVELAPDPVPAGYTYDAHEETVTVTMTDAGDGTLVPTISWGEKDGVFTNAYTAEGQIALEATKTLEGRTLKQGMFTFEVRDAQGTVVQTATNDADGKIAFEPVVFTQDDMVDASGNPVGAITRTFDIVEVDKGETGYTYDAHVEKVDVTVTDNNDGTLSCEAVYQGEGAAARFANSFAYEMDVELRAVKHLWDGSAPADGVFSFVLAPIEGNPANDPIKEPLKATNAGEAVSFGSFKYPVGEDVATYSYTIVEEDAGGPYIYDTKIYVATVTINPDCTAEVTYSTDDGAAPVFVNMPDDHPNAFNVKSPVELTAGKTVDGRKPGEAVFTFQVDKVTSDAPGTFPITATSDAEGKIVFDKEHFSFGAEDIGKTYQYRATEVNDAQAGYVYDTAGYDIFMRVYERDGVPYVYGYIQKDEVDVAQIAFANSTDEGPPPSPDEPDNPDKPQNPDKPKQPSKTPVPKAGKNVVARTGDGVPLAPIGALAVLGLCALAAASRRLRREERRVRTSGDDATG